MTAGAQRNSQEMRRPTFNLRHSRRNRIITTITSDGHYLIHGVSWALFIFVKSKAILFDPAVDELIVPLAS